MDQLNPNKKASLFKKISFSIGILLLFALIGLNVFISISVEQFPYLNNISSPSEKISFELFSNIINNEQKVLSLDLSVYGGKNAKFFTNQDVITIDTCPQKADNRICSDIASTTPIPYGSKIGGINYSVNDITQIVEISGSLKADQYSETISEKFLIIGSDYQFLTLIINIQNYLFLLAFVLILIGLTKIDFGTSKKIVNLFLVLISIISIPIIGLWISTQESLLPQNLFAYEPQTTADCRPVGASCQFAKDSCCSYYCESHTGVCKEPLDVNDEYNKLNNYIRSTITVIQTPLPKTPEDSECENFIYDTQNSKGLLGKSSWDWKLVNGYYCSYTDPTRLIYCEQHIDNSSNKTYVRYDKARSTNCDTYCVREPMGIDDHCASEEPNYENLVEAKKFFKTQYEYNGATNEIHVVVNVLKNNLGREMPTNSYKLYFEVSKNAEIVPPAGDVKFNGKKLYLTNTKSSILTMGAQFTPIDRDVDSYKASKDLSINGVTIFDFLNLNGTGFDGDTYTGFVIRKIGDDDSPVSLAISFRDTWKSFQCEMKTLFGNNPIQSGSDGLTVCRDRGPDDVDPWGYPNTGIDVTKRNVSTSNSPYISERLEPFDFFSLRSKLPGLKDNPNIKTQVIESTENDKPQNEEYFVNPTGIKDIGSGDITESVLNDFETVNPCNFLCENGTKPSMPGCGCLEEEISTQLIQEEKETNGITCGPIDVDGDKKLTITDLVKFVEFYDKLCKETKDQKYDGCGSKDVNRDGIINASDLASFKEYYYINKKSCTGLNM